MTTPNAATGLTGCDQAFLVPITTPGTATASPVYGTPFEFADPEGYSLTEATVVRRLVNKGRTIRQITQVGDTTGTLAYSTYEPVVAATVLGKTVDGTTGRITKRDDARPGRFALVLRSQGVDAGDRVLVLLDCAGNGDLTSIAAPEDDFMEPVLPFTAVAALVEGGIRVVTVEVPRTTAADMTAADVTALLTSIVDPTTAP